MVRYATDCFSSCASYCPGLRSPCRKTWVWVSIKPGRQVCVLKSITCAPAGGDAAPTSLMRSPSTVMTTFLPACSDLPSHKTPQRRYTVPVAIPTYPTGHGLAPLTSGCQQSPPSARGWILNVRHLPLLSGQVPPSVFKRIGGPGEQNAGLIRDSGRQPASGVGRKRDQVRREDAPLPLHANLH